ncbi:hypothetical protein [Algiphilus sp.]|uniref:hypothetical protein n=1 Tax=Algiphilus sp. TaxID=1872431 RepID=UPI003B51F4FC
MAYEVDATPFYRLDEQLRELPDDLPENPQPLEGVLFAYLNAFGGLLTLVMAIMRVCVERQDGRRYVAYFLPVYDQAAERILELLDRELHEGLKEGASDLVDLVYAIRDGQIGPELVALDKGLSESEGSVDPEDHLATATTVTNSLKKQIEKHTKRKWISSVLHTLNEVISIVRGAV